MEEVYNKVNKGSYEKISNQYSNDLSFMVSCLLQVQAKNRPTIDQVISVLRNREGFIDEYSKFDNKTNNFRKKKDTQKTNRKKRNNKN